MTGHYDQTDVLLSFLMSLLASWAALDLAGRVGLHRTGARRFFWLSSGAFAMGIGIWSMHYVGMLAYRMPMPVLYDWPTVLVSLLAAVCSSGIALQIASRATLSWGRTALGALCMGSGIAAMHYIGMAAMRMPAKVTYSWPLVVLSVAVAIAISMAALRLTFGSKDILVTWSRKKVASALLMGAAIPTMHYIGMAAAQWRMDATTFDAQHLQHAIAATHVSAAAIAAVAVLVLGLAVLSAGLDRRVVRYESDLRLTALQNASLNQHHRRLQDAFRAGGVGIWECDVSTGLFYVDPCLRDMYDIEHDNLPVARERWKAHVHPDDVAALDERWQECLVTSDKYENEYRVVKRNGSVCRYRSIASIIRSEQGVVQRVHGMTWDVTEERKREQETADQGERFRMTLQAIGDAVISTDENHRITFINRVACRLVGWPEAESLGRPLDEVFVCRDEKSGEILRDPVRRCLDAAIASLEGDAVLESRNGERFYIKKRIALMNGGRAAVLTFQDTTVAKRQERDLQFSANHDALTGLANRASFERSLQGLWKEAQNSSRTHCLCIVDLDRFKIINDTAGHMAGDALLIEISKILQRSLRPHDLIARMGGDEFMILLVDTNSSAGEACAMRILHDVSELRFPWQEVTYDVTASLGMVAFDGTSRSPEELISEADVATFTSKREGRNRISIYTEGDGEAAGHHHEMAIVADLRRAMEENCFELHAQPIVSTSSPDTVSAYEVLIRLRNKAGELVPPNLFIPAAERYGLMAMVDRWVIRHTLKLSSAAFQHQAEWHLAINLSADSLSDGSLWAYVQEQFLLTGVDPTRITFEITESGLIQNLEHAKEFIRLARHAGCCIALDDFGTGLSSLSYLKEFSFDILKIDGAFVRQVSSNTLDRTIVRAITEVARTLRATTVAECVEDGHTIELLMQMGVDYVQGWATGRPGPIEQILPLQDLPPQNYAAIVAGSQPLAAESSYAS